MSNKELALKIKKTVSNYESSTGFKRTILKSINELFFMSESAGGVPLGYNAIQIGDNVKIDNDKVSNILAIVKKDKRELGAGDITFSFLLHFLEDSEKTAANCNEDIGLPILDNLDSQVELTDFNKSLFIAVFKDLASKKTSEKNDSNLLASAKSQIESMFSDSDSLTELVNSYYPIIDFSWLETDPKGKEAVNTHKIIKHNKENNNNFIFKLGNKKITFNKYAAFCFRSSKNTETMVISTTGTSNERALIVLNNPGKVLTAGYEGEKDSFLAVKSFNDIYNAFKKEKKEEEKELPGFTKVNLELTDGAYVSGNNETKFPYSPAGVLKVAAAPGSNATTNINFLIDPFLNIVYAGEIKETWDKDTLSLWTEYEGRFQPLGKDDETPDMNKYLSVLIASKVIRKFNKDKWIEDVNNGSVGNSGDYYIDRGVDYTGDNSKILKSINGNGDDEGISGLARSTDSQGGENGGSLLKIINSVREMDDINDIVNFVISYEETIKTLSTHLTSHLETSIKLCKIIKAFRENKINKAFEIIAGESKIEYKGETQVRNYFDLQSGKALQESKYRLGKKIISERFIKSSIQKLLLEANELDEEAERLKSLKDLKGKSKIDLGEYWKELKSSRTKVSKTFNEYVKKNSGENPGLTNKKMLHLLNFIKKILYLQWKLRQKQPRMPRKLRLRLRYLSPKLVPKSNLNKKKRL